MALIPPSIVRNVRGIPDAQLDLMRTYLQGAVYSWVKNRSGEWFAVRDLVGGGNFEWQGTPLYPLFEKHLSLGKDNNDSITAAAKDAGWLLKRVLDDDKRHFEVGRSGLTAAYRWMGNEP